MKTLTIVITAQYGLATIDTHGMAIITLAPIIALTTGLVVV